MKRCAVVVLLASFAAPAAAAMTLRGEPADFVLNCAGCHKFDGSGSARVPVLTEMGRVLAVPGGREYLARVPGVAQAPLSDARLAALLNWLLAELGGAPPASPYTAAEVGALRAAPLRDPVAARAALLVPAAP
jgi:mono/diheme cytochrome c family protein